MGVSGGLRCFGGEHIRSTRESPRGIVLLGFPCSRDQAAAGT